VPTHLPVQIPCEVSSAHTGPGTPQVHLELPKSKRTFAMTHFGEVRGWAASESQELSLDLERWIKFRAPRDSPSAKVWPRIYLAVERCEPNPWGLRGDSIQEKGGQGSQVMYWILPQELSLHNLVIHPPPPVPSCFSSLLPQKPGAILKKKKKVFLW
jgi:hypothetical protein